MNDNTQNPQDHSASTSSSNRIVFGVTASIVVLFVAGAALIPYLIGYGWFGHRLLLYGEGQLYVLNLHDETHHVSVDGRAPVEIPGDDATILPLVGGPTSVEVQDQQNQVIDSWETELDHSDAFLNLSDDTCFVLAELANLSGNNSLEVEIIEVLDADTDFVPLDTHHVVWPRGNPGAVDDTAESAVAIELMDCELLGEREFLGDYLQTRLEARM